MKDAVAAELNLHATEELNHAMLVANRIIQLGGTPVLMPEGWGKMSSCKYDAPDEEDLQSLREDLDLMVQRGSK